MKPGATEKKHPDSVSVAFHLDEHIPPALAETLRNRGIDATTTADASLDGTADREHLAFATQAGKS